VIGDTYRSAHNIFFEWLALFGIIGFLATNWVALVTAALNLSIVWLGKILIVTQIVKTIPIQIAIIVNRNCFCVIYCSFTCYSIVAQQVLIIQSCTGIFPCLLLGLISCYHC
jgi:hypothetical protein